MVDVGCGTGTWLANFKNLGTAHIQGYDGYLRDTKLLEIPEENFSNQDLTKPLESSVKFDLCMCLEVAEHLPQSSALTLVESICSLSDFVLFSAAIPGQGGLHHLNEQWQEYWVEQFEKSGYKAFDYIRPKIWNNSKIQFWYKQNILLFVKSKRSFELDISEEEFFNPNLVHPDLYAHKCNLEKNTEKSNLKILTEKIMRKFIL